MISFYKTINTKTVEIDLPEEGCWVSVVAPTEKEIDFLLTEMKLDSGFVKSSLDEEETSRIENEEDQTLMIIDLSQMQPNPTKNDTILYSTTPVGIIITPAHVVTIALHDNPVLNEMANGSVKGINTNLKTRFVLLFLLRVAARYLQMLRQIDRISENVEKQLHLSMKNKELIQMLGLEKSLVYFSTSLKSNEMTLEKILRGRVIKLYEDDQELLEDVLIEIRQAIQMSDIYTNILSGTMDAFASVISNNLNIVMKVLTSITILLTVPTLISSFYGMNVEGIPLPNFWIIAGISVLITLGAAVWLRIKKML